MVVTPHAEIQTHVVPDQQGKPEVAAQLPQNIGPTGPAITGASAGTDDGVATRASARPAPALAPEIGVCAEVMPEFVGGRTALQHDLQQHLRFPGVALAAQFLGRVYASFMVQTDGSIGDVTVLKDLSFGTEEAAARTVREMPAWTPGVQNHRPVAVRFTLPITFQFE